MGNKNKSKATDMKFLKMNLPIIGEYLKNYLSGKPNMVFPDPKLLSFIKDGKIDDNTWLLRKGLVGTSSFESPDVSFELKIEIHRL